MTTTAKGLENARAFFEGLEREQDNRQAVYSNLVQLAKDRGHDCTLEELDQVLRELLGSGQYRVPYSEPPAF